MTEQSEPRPNAEITLTVEPGHPGQSDRILRVSPDQAQFLRECLEAEGLHVSRVLEFSAGSWLEVIAVALGSGGAVTTLAIALQKFLERHKDKNVSFGPEGRLESMAGYSAKHVQQVLITRLGDGKNTATPAKEADLT